MRIEELITDRHDPDRPLSDREYSKLRSRFFFNLPIIEDENGRMLNPPDDPELFDRFLDAAANRDEIFNPTYDYAN